MTNDRNYTWYMFIKIMKEHFQLSVSWMHDQIVLSKESTRLVTIPKSNKMSHELVQSLLGKMEINMEDFEKGYQNTARSEFR